MFAASRRARIAAHVFVFLAAGAIIISRRPDAILNAQFFAEDGTVWFSDAYSLGVGSLAMPQAGYLHSLTRLIALFAQFFPFTASPLVMNLCAIAIKFCPLVSFCPNDFLRFPFLLGCWGHFCTWLCQTAMRSTRTLRVSTGILRCWRVSCCLLNPQSHRAGGFSISLP